jgi:hypothetical protein
MDTRWILERTAGNVAQPHWLSDRHVTPGVWYAAAPRGLEDSFLARAVWRGCENSHRTTPSLNRIIQIHVRV